MPESVPVYKKITALLKKRVNSMRVDDRVPSEAALCQEFSVSRMTVNKVIESLTKEGILYRIKGSGTFVRSRPAIGRQALRFLLPCPDFFAYDCTYNLQTILCGVMRQAAATGLEVRCVPVSKVNNPEIIDRKVFEDFDVETTVFITGSWFQKIFPIIRSKCCKTIFLDHSGRDGKKHPQFLRKGLVITINSRSLMAEAVMRIADAGRRKIGYVYDNYPQDDPLNTGFNDGLASVGLSATPERQLYFGNYDQTRNSLLDPKNDYDALVVSSPLIIGPVAGMLREAGRKIPDDVAVLVYHDHRKLLDFDPPLSAAAMPFMRIGRDVARLLAEGGTISGVKEYSGVIFERESLRRGAGSNPNPECAPDSTALP